MIEFNTELTRALSDYGSDKYKRKFSITLPRGTARKPFHLLTREEQQIAFEAVERIVKEGYALVGREPITAETIKKR